MKTKIPVLSLPWTCWRCNKPMRVMYPPCKEVYESEFRGSLAPTYSRTMGEHVIGNLCPHCEAYQGNWFVQDDGLMGHAYELKEHLVGFIEIKVNCLICRKELSENSNVDDLFSQLQICCDYLEVENLGPEDKEEAYKDRIEALDSSWLCSQRYKTESVKREKNFREKRLQLIRDGPLIECPLCKKNTRENPETMFTEHHLSYLPEEKMIVCSSCHMKIHHSNAYPELKPKDIRRM